MPADLRSFMSMHDIDWFIVFSQDPHLSEYTGECDKYREAVSGFTGSAGTFVCGPNETLLWTDSRYYLQAERQLKGSGTVLMKQGLSKVPSPEEYLFNHVWEGQRVAFDLKSVSYERYMKIREKLPESVEIVDGLPILKEAVNNLPARSFSPVDEMPLSAAGKGTPEKLSDVRDIIRKTYVREESYTYILSDLTSIMWLFNLRGQDIEHVPVAYSYAVITQFCATLYINRRSLSEEARNMLYYAGVTVKEYSRFYAELSDIATDVVLADHAHNNSAILTGFEEAGILKKCSDVKIIRKAVKNRAETEGMVKSHIKDAVTMIRFIMHVKELAAKDELSDEYELGRQLDDMRLGAGCCDISFDTICAYGRNSAIVHYSADPETAAKVFPEGFLLLDSGGQYRFCGTTDITRTISLGKLTDEEKKIYTIVLKANLRLMDAVFPEGYKGVLLDGIAEAALWDEGYFCGHGIGHGVGHYLCVHESEARISRSAAEDETAFFPGVIVSNEPGVYMEGKFGVRLENLLLTVGAGEIDGNRMCRFTPLTLVPFDKEAIDVSLLSEREKKILADYNALILDKISPLLDDKERSWLRDQFDQGL